MSEHDEDEPWVVFFAHRGEELAVVSLPFVSRLLAKLTPSEREVARAAIGGASNAAIADARGTSERTVANQLSAVYRKLGITSRAELTALVCRVKKAR